MRYKYIQQEDGSLKEVTPKKKTTKKKGSK